MEVSREWIRENCPIYVKKSNSNMAESFTYLLKKHYEDGMSEDEIRFLIKRDLDAFFSELTY
jgi:hypothetical protein